MNRYLILCLFISVTLAQEENRGGEEPERSETRLQYQQVTSPLRPQNIRTQQDTSLLRPQNVRTQQETTPSLNNFQLFTRPIRPATSYNELRNTNLQQQQAVTTNPLNQVPYRPTSPLNTNQLDQQPLDTSPPRFVDPRCNDRPRGQTYHPENCALFYNCWDEIVLLEACPNGLHFDAEKGYCDYPENVNCQGRTATEPPISTENCPTLWGLFPGPSCSVFYNCIDGASIEVSCPPGLAFDVRSKSCQYPEKVPGCENILPFQCPDQYGNHPVEGNCKQFWLCVDGNARLLSCDYGKQFDRLSRKCSNSYNNSC